MNNCVKQTTKGACGLLLDDGAVFWGEGCDLHGVSQRETKVKGRNANDPLEFVKFELSACVVTPCAFRNRCLVCGVALIAIFQ
jgi:hypothetical protein